MDIDFSCDGPGWGRYPLTSAHADARRWIQHCAMLGLAGNTVSAYARAIEGFLAFCNSLAVEVRRASREVIARYVQHLRTRPRCGSTNIICIDSQGHSRMSHCSSI